MLEPPEPEFPAPQPIPAVTRNTAVKIHIPSARSKLLRFLSRKMPSKPPGKAKIPARYLPSPAPLTAALVPAGSAIVTVVDCTVVVPSVVTLAGAKVQLEPFGRPLQANVTVPANEFVVTRERVKYELWPVLLDTEVGFAESVNGVVFPPVPFVIVSVPSFSVTL